MHSPGARTAFWVGVREAVIVVPSYLPFALVCGVASVNAGLTTGAALALPALVFAGSSQAVLTQFIQNSASLWVAILSGCVINLRMAVYSAALSAKVRSFSTGQRMLIAAFLVDNSFAFMQKREEANPTDPHIIAYYAGLTAVFWPTWLVFCAIRSLPTAAAAVVGGAASVLLFSLPLKLGLIAACLFGLMAGLISEKGARLWTARKAG